MARICTLCVHPERAAMEAAIVAGDPIRRVATHFGITEQSMRRHRNIHLPRALLNAAHTSREINELQLAGSLAEQTAALRAKTAELIASAERSGDIRTALFAVREAGRLIEMQARITGQLDRRDAAEKPTIDARSQVVVILPDNGRDPIPTRQIVSRIDTERLMLEA